MGLQLKAATLRSSVMTQLLYRSPCAFRFSIGDPKVASLLCPLIDGLDGIEKCIASKTKLFEFIGSRLCQLHSHDVLCFSCHGFSITKLLYILCITCSLSSPSLATSPMPTLSYQRVSDTNISLAKFGGLRVRNVTMLVPSASCISFLFLWSSLQHFGK